MKLKSAIVFCSLFFFAYLTAGAQDKEVLFSIDNEPVYTSEFIRVYKKNLGLVQDESQKNIDSYLDLFVNYKLKIKEAQALGLDEKKPYLREFNKYKKQLVKNYISENYVTDALVKEAYDRTKEEVNASHILIKINENAAPKDTLLAYKEIQKLRNRALKEGFEAVRKDVHNGKTIFGEDLGYFSAFKMVYPFESAAYNTSVGEISQPFRTRFGYHIVNVKETRKARGEITVAHIMLNSSKDKTDKELETRINEVYKRIKQGEDFEALAKQFSEDKSSVKRGGKLHPFSSGEISSIAFEDQAFGLKNKGDITKPFKSKFGWHIVKLYDKKPLGDFKDLEIELKAKIKKDSRSKLINSSRLKKLIKRYNLNEEQTALSYFASLLNESYYSRKWKLPEGFQADKVLFSIKDEKVLYEEFGLFLAKSQRRSRSRKPFNTIVEEEYKKFFESRVFKYQEAHLEEENEEYAQIVNEYREGLLLFDLMETKIWTVAATDSLGLKAYYKQYESKYVSEERVDAIVASASKKKTIKQVATLLKANETVEAIKAAINTNNKIHVSFTSEVMNSSHQALPKGFEFKKGISEVYKHNNAYVVVKVKEILPAAQKSFEDAKGRVIADYQNFKEQKWLESLHTKYDVSINKDVLESVKSKIKTLN